MVYELEIKWLPTVLFNYTFIICSVNKQHMRIYHVLDSRHTQENRSGT